MEQTSGRKILPVPGPWSGQLEILSFLRIACVLGQQGPQGFHVTNGKTETSVFREEKQFSQSNIASYFPQ